MAVIILIVLIIAIVWYNDYSKYINTDDAYIETDNVAISSKILGRIVKEYYDEGDTVRTGDMIAELDSNDLIASRNQSLALIDQAKTSRLQAEKSYLSDSENIKIIVVNLDKAKDDFDRAKKQFEGNVISSENYEHTKKALELLKAQLNAAIKNLDVSRAKIGSAASAVKTAEAQLEQVNTNLKNTKLFSPMNGMVAKRWLLTGDIISPGQSVFTIIKNRNLHVIVYLEETSISKIFNGQISKFTIDAFPGCSFMGKVYNIGSNTASQFSLIPPSNASGNFTKVTQRIPIKISIESVDPPGKISSYKILPGMSVIVKITK